MKDAGEFLNKFELKNTKLHDVMTDVIEGPREAKLLYMESLLLRQFAKMADDPGSPEQAKDMKALVTKQNIFSHPMISRFRLQTCIVGCGLQLKQLASC